jgi:hypothetical protein
MNGRLHRGTEAKLDLVGCGTEGHPAWGVTLPACTPAVADPSFAVKRGFSSVPTCTVASEPPAAMEACCTLLDTPWLLGAAG